MCGQNNAEPFASVLYEKLITADSRYFFLLD